MKITDKIKSFEDACESLNINPSIPDFSAIPEKLVKPLIAHYKLCIIAEALNEGHVFHWSNGKWDKWFPWFYMNDSSASGRFSFGGSGDRHSYSGVGSRLCYKSRELSDYAGRQFEDLYRDYFVKE